VNLTRLERARDGRANSRRNRTPRNETGHGMDSQHLGVWAQGRGRVVPEWRLRVTLPGGKTHPLVPDVAYMSFERLRTLSGKALQHPAIAPEIVVEIRSPNDARADVDAKIEEYLAWGISLVLVAEPNRRRMNAYDVSGT
jgi:Uma2 family endonuclease